MPHIATFNYQIYGDNGFSCGSSGDRITVDQYESLLRVLGGRQTSAEARLREALEKIQAQLAVVNAERDVALHIFELAAALDNIETITKEALK